MKTCPKCQAALEQEDVFCKNCGHSFVLEQPVNCWSCNKQISKADNYCRYCGSGQRGKVSFYYTHLGVWVLFALLLPFAIWFVWKSPVISKRLKWVYTVLMLFLTWYFCYSFYIALNKVFSEYQQVFNLAI